MEFRSFGLSWEELVEGIKKKMSLGFGGEKLNNSGNEIAYYL